MSATSKNIATSQTGSKFQLNSNYLPAGGQIEAIDFLTKSLLNNNREQTLKGVTGCGKTFIMANIIEKLQRPTLVIAHNKTLAAQLAEEFKRFFPNNAVHYFVSYYDYYQPESYMPKTDTFIEKQTQINEEIERLRNASTQALLTRSDVLIVSSVSCIYGLGDPNDYLTLKIEIKVGETHKINKLTRRLADMQFSRTNSDLKRGNFRVRGELLEVYPVNEDKTGYRIVFWGDEVEKIESFDTVTNQAINNLDTYTIFPAKQYVTTFEKIKNAADLIDSDLQKRIKEFEDEGKLLPAERIKQRTLNDVEMLLQLGFCGGIENYSLYFDGRNDGEPPSTLLDYFPDNALTFIDESHITLPQIGAMYAGDRSRKETLIEHGFRLPSALNNRPLKRKEFFEKVNQMIYVSATPGNFELGYGNLE
jgi:excinuclease ABC subunit B